MVGVRHPPACGRASTVAPSKKVAVTPAILMHPSFTASGSRPTCHMRLTLTVEDSLTETDSTE